jgi:predicted adenylyl cyclase CyaB
MKEVELKAVVPDVKSAVAKLMAAGATLVQQGRLEDRRYDTPDGALSRKDEVLRVRNFRGLPKAETSLDWKGPTHVESGYKVREEITLSVGDCDALEQMVTRLGYRLTMAIDRDITQLLIAGTTVRFERYPRMDDLVEVEGTPESIEAAIKLLGLPRRDFTSDRLTAFIARFEERTGVRAALCDSEMEIAS